MKSWATVGHSPPSSIKRDPGRPWSNVSIRQFARVALGPAHTVSDDVGARSRSPCSRAIVLTRPEVHRDVLRLEVLVHPLRAALAAEAGLLDAAKRRARVRDHALVEADHPGLELLDDAERAIDVAREHVRHQAVLGVVGCRDRI